MRSKANKVHPHIGMLVGMLVVSALAPLIGNSINCNAQERNPQARQFETSSAQPPGAAITPNVIVSPNEDYRIGPSDVIELRVQDAPELSGTFRMSAAGSFLLPVLGNIAAQQKTPEELSNLIADGLRNSYLRTPQVTVVVKQINSRSFFIQGAVRRPGLYQIEGHPSLLKLITVAGGLSDNYGSIAFIIREIKQPKESSSAKEANQKEADQADQEANQEANLTTDSGEPTRDQASASTHLQTQPSVSKTPSSVPEDDAKYELVKANINSLLRGNFDQNVPMEPGDIVHIPPADVFFVAGEVNSPGSFQLKEGTTLRQAISLAQGTNFEAATGRGVIFREDPTSGKRQEIKVDIAAVMSGRKDDIPVIANDIIIIPNSRFKSVTGTLLRAFGVNAPRTLNRKW